MVRDHMKRIVIVIASLTACTPAAVPPPAVVEPAPVIEPARVVEPAPSVEAPVVIDPIFVADVPEGPLRAVYGVYVDIDELTPAGLSTTERARWQATRATARTIREPAAARALWLSTRFTKALAKHDAKCRREGYGPDASCDADLVLCAQDYAVPRAITMTKQTASSARATVSFIEMEPIAVDLVREAGAWRIDAVHCPR